MTCRELLQRFLAALEKDKLDVDLLNKLMNKCNAYGVEALRAAARKLMQFAGARAWAYYRGSIIAERNPAAAYGSAVHFIWRLSDWYEMPCDVLAEYAIYIAEAAAKYQWPAKWPFVVPAAVAAEENNCELPDTVAEVLGADEYSRLESFLEQGEAVVEVAPGWKIALVRDGQYISIVV
jgi:hypothetical protein